MSSGKNVRPLVREQACAPHISKQWQDANFEPIASAIEQIVKYLIDNRIVSNGADARLLIAFEQSKVAGDVIDAKPR